MSECSVSMFRGLCTDLVGCCLLTYRAHLQRGFVPAVLEFLPFTPAQAMGRWCKKEGHPSSTTRMAASPLPVSHER